MALEKDTPDPRPIQRPESAAWSINCLEGVLLVVVSVVSAQQTKRGLPEGFSCAIPQ
jgi:hypothetical protein